MKVLRKEKEKKLLATYACVYSFYITLYKVVSTIQDFALSFGNWELKHYSHP